MPRLKGSWGTGVLHTKGPLPGGWVGRGSLPPLRTELLHWLCGYFSAIRSP